jgi:hypothetical protein
VNDPLNTIIHIKAIIHPQMRATAPNRNKVRTILNKCHPSVKPTSKVEDKKKRSP